MEATNVGCAAGLVVYRDNGKRPEYTTEEVIKIEIDTLKDNVKIGTKKNTREDWKIYKRYNERYNKGDQGPQR